MKLTPRMIDALESVYARAAAETQGFTEKWDWPTGLRAAFHAADQALLRMKRAESRAWRLSDVYNPKK